MLQGTNPVRLVNKKTTIKADGTNFRSGPNKTDEMLVQYDADILIYPDYLVQGGLANGSTGWYGTWADTPGGRTFCYVHESTVNPLGPIEPTGYTQDQLNAAKLAARADGIKAAQVAVEAVK